MQRVVCTMCNDNLDQHESVAFTCGHVFHVTCIGRIINSTCPMCRQPLGVPQRLLLELRDDEPVRNLVNTVSRIIGEINTALVAIDTGVQIDENGNAETDNVVANEDNEEDEHDIERGARNRPQITLNQNGNEAEIIVPLPWPNLLPGRRTLYINVVRGLNDLQIRVVRRRGQQWTIEDNPEDA